MGKRKRQSKMQSAQQKVVLNRMLMDIGYKHQSVIYKQIKAVLQQHPTLRVQDTQHVFNNGNQQRLLCLHGTIQIVYQNIGYHTPVRITLLLNYPEVAPLCYVEPQRGMGIRKNHPNVDLQGVIYHQSLAPWHPQSTLCGLIAALTTTFSAMPPLFAVPVSPQQQRHDNNLRGASDRETAEKLVRTQLQAIYDHENGKIKQFTSNNKRLDQHSKELSDCKTKLQAESQALRERQQALQQMIARDTEWIDNHETTSIEEMNLNELLLACDSWSAQCMEEVAHSTAFQDAMSQLDDYLEEEVITMDQYLKQIAKLGREQFIRMATAIRVKQLQQDLIHDQEQHKRQSIAYSRSANEQQSKSKENQSDIACDVCGQKAILRCSRCKNRYYCSTEHQLSDWKGHDKNCYQRNQGFGNRFSS